MTMTPSRSMGWLPRIAAAVCVAALCSAGAIAQSARGTAPSSPTPFQGFQQNNKEPIKIESISLEVRDKEKIATFIDNVKVVQGDTTLECRRLVVFYDQEPTPAATKGKAPPKSGMMSPPADGGQQQIRRLEAKGGVVVTQKDQIATGDNGVYEMKTNSIVLDRQCGHDARPGRREGRQALCRHDHWSLSRRIGHCWPKRSGQSLIRSGRARCQARRACCDDPGGHSAAANRRPRHGSPRADDDRRDRKGRRQAGAIAAAEAELTVVLSRDPRRGGWGQRLRNLLRPRARRAPPPAARGGNGSWDARFAPLESPNIVRRGTGYSDQPIDDGGWEAAAQTGYLAVHGVEKSFAGRKVVRGASLYVARGEAVGLLGPNGAGKTTIFYMVTGLIKADRGRIELDGHDITRLPMYRRARLGIGYLPQEASIFRGLTVEENIRAVLEAVEPSAKRRQAELDALLEEFNIARLRKTPSIALSGGERRRVEIARALATRPSYMLLDEPFAGIDPIAVGDIQTLVRHLTQRGIGVLITDHNVRETLGLTDRAYIIYSGEVLMEGRTDDIVQRPGSAASYISVRNSGFSSCAGPGPPCYMQESCRDPSWQPRTAADDGADATLGDSPRPGPGHDAAADASHQAAATVEP